VRDFQVGAAETKVGGTGNSDDHARLDVAECGRKRVLPFFTEELSDPFEGVDCPRAEHGIDGDNKGNKGAAVLVTFLCCLKGVFSFSYCDLLLV